MGPLERGRACREVSTPRSRSWKRRLRRHAPSAARDRLIMAASLVWSDVLAHMRDLAIAYALALPIGWDRERAARSAGVRTFPLVAIATCGLVLVATGVMG